uniref:Uncharacterized protein n=1 Tax=Arundo donax TaxID=35708 RepID=A0A0A9CA62_ARUDO
MHSASTYRFWALIIRAIRSQVFNSDPASNFNSFFAK